MINLVEMKLNHIFKILLVSVAFTFGAYALFTDYSLPKITGIKSLVDRNSVGFEWKSLAKYKNVTGVNIYRAIAKPGIKQVYIKIDSIRNRFATHYVDRKIKPNTKYFYTFTTTSGFSESIYGDIVPIKTKPTHKAINFVEAKLVDRGVVKLLWFPSPDYSIIEYIIQRKRLEDKRWFYLDRVKGRLYPEFIDSTVKQGKIYMYRVFARDANEFISAPSRVLQVEVK